jgi:hypothetical protein
MIGGLVVRRVTATGFAATAIQRLGMKANCTLPGTETQYLIDPAITQACIIAAAVSERQPSC